MKRRLFALVMVIVLLFTMIPSAFADDPFDVTYDDVSYDDWFGTYVYLISAMGYMNGTGDGKFSPQAELTRAMFLTVLGRIEGISQNYYDSFEPEFKDVESGQWYSAYVAWGVEKGITEGVGDGKFAPDEPITREQMATMVYRYTQIYDITLNGLGAAVSSFKDEDETSDYAVEAVELMRNTGIITGDDNGYFNPGDNATRAQAATVFSRLILTLPEDSYIATEGKDYQVNYTKAHVFTDDLDMTWCYYVAEVENIGDNVLCLSSANFDFKNDSGEIIAAEETYGGSPFTFEPGEKSYFYGEALFDDTVEDEDLLINFRSEVVKTPSLGTKISVSDVTLSEKDGYIEAKGEFKNITDETAYADIEVILYDDSGSVITILFVMEDSFAADASVAFECGNWMPTDMSMEDIADYDAFVTIYPN